MILNFRIFGRKENKWVWDGVVSGEYFWISLNISYAFFQVTEGIWSLVISLWIINLWIFGSYYLIHVLFHLLKENYWHYKLASDIMRIQFIIPWRDRFPIGKTGHAFGPPVERVPQINCPSKLKLNCACLKFSEKHQQFLYAKVYWIIMELWRNVIMVQSQAFISLLENVLVANF